MKTLIIIFRIFIVLILGSVFTCIPTLILEVVCNLFQESAISYFLSFWELGIIWVVVCALFGYSLSFIMVCSIIESKNKKDY